MKLVNTCLISKNIFPVIARDMCQETAMPIILHHKRVIWRNIWELPIAKNIKPVALVVNDCLTESIPKEIINADLIDRHTRVNQSMSHVSCAPYPLNTCWFPLIVRKIAMSFLILIACSRQRASELQAAWGSRQCTGPCPKEWPKLLKLYFRNQNMIIKKWYDNSTWDSGLRSEAKMCLWNTIMWKVIITLWSANMRVLSGCTKAACIEIWQTFPHSPSWYFSGIAKVRLLTLFLWDHLW